MDTRLSIGELKKMALFPAHILKLQPVLNIPLCHVSCLTNFGLISSAVLTFSGFKQTNKQMSKLYKQSEKEFRNKFSINWDFLERFGILERVLEISHLQIKSCCRIDPEVQNYWTFSRMKMERKFQIISICKL